MLLGYNVTSELVSPLAEMRVTENELNSFPTSFFQFLSITDFFSFLGFFWSIFRADAYIYFFFHALDWGHFLTRNDRLFLVNLPSVHAAAVEVKSGKFSLTMFSVRVFRLTVEIWAHLLVVI